MVGIVETSGDVAAAASAFGALVLVFFGLSVSSWDGYSAEAKGDVRARYRWRAWPAFVALLASVLSCGASLYAKATDCELAAFWGAGLLAIVGIAILISALQFLMEIG